MPDVSVTIKGVEELQRKLGAVTADLTVRTPMKLSTLALKQDLAKYPGERPASTYVRTGTLGRSWTQKVSGFALKMTGIVGNVVSYGPWVQSAAKQVWFHKETGWRTDEQVMLKHKDGIVRVFAKAIEGAMGK